MLPHSSSAMGAYAHFRRFVIVVAGLTLGHIGTAVPARAGSMVTSTTPGSGISYDVVNVSLEADDGLTFQVEVDPNQASALDVFLLNDLTGSFRDDLPQVRAAISDLNRVLPAIANDIQWGLGSFTDKPIFPFGGLIARDTDGDGVDDEIVSAADYPYQTELALTDDLARLQAAVDQLSIGLGTDEPESQLEALLQVALRSRTELGFRDQAFKTVVLQTDAPFHFANDSYRTDASGNPLPFVIRDENGNFITRDYLDPNNGDTVFDPWEDYPLVSQVRDALFDASIVPIFAVTENVRSYYDDLVAQLGVGEVVILSSDSSNLVGAIQEGIGNALRDVTLVAQSDDFDYVRQIASDTTGEKEATDFDVPLGATAKFQVTLEDRSGDGLTGQDTLFLKALGYGTVTVNVTNKGANPTQKVPEPGLLIGLAALGLWTIASNQARVR